LSPARVPIVSSNFGSVCAKCALSILGAGRVSHTSDGRSRHCEGESSGQVLDTKSKRELTAESGKDLA